MKPKKTRMEVGENGANSIRQRDSLAHTQIQVEPDRQEHGYCMNAQGGFDEKCNSNVKKFLKKDLEESQSQNEGEKGRGRHGDGGGGGSKLERPTEVVKYIIVSISQQQLQPSFFISFPQSEDGALLLSFGAKSTFKMI